MVNEIHKKANKPVEVVGLAASVWNVARNARLPL